MATRTLTKYSGTEHGTTKQNIDDIICQNCMAEWRHTVWQKMGEWRSMGLYKNLYGIMVAELTIKYEILIAVMLLYDCLHLNYRHFCRRYWIMNNNWMDAYNAHDSVPI